MPLHRYLLVLFLLTACSIKATPAALTPNVPPQQRLRGAARIIGFEVPEGEVCAQKKGMRNLCVSGLRESLGTGFKDIMGRFFSASAGPEAHSAEFRFVGLQQRSTPAKSGSAVATELSMNWRFMLKDPSGKVRIDITEHTVAPEEMINVASASRTVTVLLNAVLERIAKAIVDAQLDVPVEPEPAEAVAAAPATLCVPGATQECVGAGACKGGQSCLPDGSGFSPCNCGGAPADPLAK